MKAILKLLPAVTASIIMCSIASNALAQSPLATWSCGPLLNGGGTTPAPFTNNTGAAQLIISPIMKGPGIGIVGTGDAYGGNAWTNAGVSDSEANSIANGLYLTYTVQAVTNYSVSFATNFMFLHASSTGPHNCELQYSTDGINYTDLSGLTIASGTTSTVWTNNLSTNSFLQNVSSSTTNFFRVVCWGANGVAGTWYIYDPVPSYAAGVLGTNDFVINGTMTAQENLATWWCGPLLSGGGAAPAPFTNNTTGVGVIVTPLMKGPGVGAVTTGDAYGGNTWTNAGLADSEANSIANGLYLTYAVQAATNYIVSFGTSYMFLHASSTGPHNCELQYSTDGVNYTDLSGLTIASGTTSTVWTNNLSTNSFLQNVPSSTTNFFRVVCWGANGTGGTWYIYDPLPAYATNVLGTNDFTVQGAVTALQGFPVIGVPANVVITPTNIATSAGQTVQFNFTASGAAASNFWYSIIGSQTNLVSTATTLTLTNVVGTNAGNYYLVLTNAGGSATSALASLTVIDPVLEAEPANTEGMIDGTVQFAVAVAGFSPAYQWYYSDGNGNLLAPVLNGTSTPGGTAVVSGATSSLLTISGLQNADALSLTNLVLVATNMYGAVTSTPASIVYGTNTPPVLSTNNSLLAFWDFDGSQVTNCAINYNCIYNPTPFVGSGTALAVGSAYNPPAVETLPKLTNNTLQSPYASGASDAADQGEDPGSGLWVYTPYGFEQPSPNLSWGTDNYPAASTGTNKANGVQFNVSTVGAKNIRISFDGRVSSTASDYFRLQYTTNGTTWIDYPSSSSFDGLASTSGNNNGYYTFNYNLAGFPGVDNNPNFGIRIVTEWQSTATYQTPATIANPNQIGANGVFSTNTWVAVANTYGTTGTFTFDLVAVRGDAITNTNTPPVIGPFANMPVINGLATTNMVDTNTLILNFTASSAQTPPSGLTFNVMPVNTVAAAPLLFSQTVNPDYSVVNTGSTNFQLTLSFSSGIPDSLDAAPILITATDANGETASSWFMLDVSSVNRPPTNTLTAIHTTNTLANTPISIPFLASGIFDGTTNLQFSITSDNNTVIPVNNVVISGNTNTGNLVLTITPAVNQVGNALINVTVIDNSPVEAVSTPANISVAVRPNTNIIAIDYFNYDNGGGLDAIAAGYWGHLSGVNGQLQETGSGGSPADVAIISDGNTENVQAPLVGSPYKTNSGAILYSSFTVSISTLANLPTGNGSYIVSFNDGSGDTAAVEDCLVVATNAAAPGNYRLGIANLVGANAGSAQMFPQDLSLGTTYFVVTALSLNNAFSTLWVSPTNQFAPSVMDTSLPATPTNIVNIELRESGTVEGIVNVGSLLVGLSFNSVFYPAVANAETFGISENSTNVLNPLFNDAGWALDITSITPDANGTATLNGGTNITFIPNNDFTGTATVGYTIQDNLGNTSSSTLTVVITNNPPLANPVSYTVPENSVNNVLNPLTNDVVETPGGSLSLVSVSETDGNGSATVSGNQVLFTPTSGFTSIASINYTITDNLGGTSSGVISVFVGNPTPIPLMAALVNNTNLVISWTNAAFSLQYSTNVAGPYVTIPGATSPYTNLTTTNTDGFFRLMLSH